MLISQARYLHGNNVRICGERIRSYSCIVALRENDCPITWITIKARIFNLNAVRWHRNLLKELNRGVLGQVKVVSRCNRRGLSIEIYIVVRAGYLVVSGVSPLWGLICSSIHLYRNNARICPCGWIQNIGVVVLYQRNCPKGLVSRIRVGNSHRICGHRPV